MANISLRSESLLSNMVRGDMIEEDSCFLLCVRGGLLGL